jgi:uncharacterized sulfatase
MEPHRNYTQGLGASAGIDPAAIDLPKFLPESETIRRDMADYLFEIQWFDSHLMRMLDRLAERGELENTLVIVTSDNGMPFPRAKANLYEYGIHMPLAIAWPARIEGGQNTSDLVSLIDVTRTIFDAAGVTTKHVEHLRGISLLGHYSRDAKSKAPPRQYVYSARERHSSARFNTLGYPSRCIRSSTHLYIRNFKPERWPAGAPQKFDRIRFDDSGNVLTYTLGKPHGGYHDIDDGPTLQWMIDNRELPEVAPLFDAAVAKRPAEELYDIRTDPDCLRNLADDGGSAGIKQTLSASLTEYLIATGDLRQTSPREADVWETYPRYSQLRWFPTPEWAEKDPLSIPNQPWLESQRPRND